MRQRLLRLLAGLLLLAEVQCVSRGLRHVDDPWYGQQGSLAPRPPQPPAEAAPEAGNASAAAAAAPVQLMLRKRLGGEVAEQAWQKYRLGRLWIPAKAAGVRLWIPANAAGFEDEEETVRLQATAVHRKRKNPFRSSRVRRWHVKPASRSSFFVSATGFAWTLFICALVGFLALHMYLLDWPSTRWYHGVALLIWLFAGALYCFLILEAFGQESGTTWLTGYLLEFVFSLENVFIFHIVVSAFNAPRKVTQKALFIVILCQICFQMFLFMGLASWLQSIFVLPYLLGLWLLYVGAKTWNGAEDENFHIEESSVFQLLKRGLGDRLVLKFEEDHVFTSSGGKIHITMLGPLVCCLLLVDLLMEVDVTLTKIEEIESHYLSFTSSAAAAFAVPELYFVARDLFRRYEKLKYGISFALLYFGAELMLHDLVHIADMVGLCIIGVVLLICIVVSKLTKPADQSDVESDCDSSRRAAFAAFVKDTRLPKDGSREEAAVAKAASPPVRQVS